MASEQTLSTSEPSPSFTRGTIRVGSAPVNAMQPKSAQLETSSGREASPGIEGTASLEAAALAFAASLPEEYRQRFNLEQQLVHAQISATRGEELADARLFPWAGPGLTGICVVAQDRPGLLSLISRALAQTGFDVDAAEAWTRSDNQEAVDVFWVRDPEGKIHDEEIRAFVRQLRELLLGRDSRSLPPPSPAVENHGTTVRFLEDSSGALSVLEVETDDRSGLLWAITRALYEQNVQIIASKIRTEATRVYDRFVIVELNGSPIRPDRRLLIQVAVLSAIQP